MGDDRQVNTSSMKVLVLLAILGTCAAKYYDSGYSSGAGYNSGFSGSRGGSFGFSNGNSGLSREGYCKLHYPLCEENGSNGASGFGSSRSYGPAIHVGVNQNSGSGSSGFGSSFIAADNGFNSRYGGSSGGSSGRII